MVGEHWVTVKFPFPFWVSYKRDLWLQWSLRRNLDPWSNWKLLIRVFLLLPLEPSHNHHSKKHGNRGKNTGARLAGRCPGISQRRKGPGRWRYISTSVLSIVIEIHFPGVLLRMLNEGTKLPVRKTLFKFPQACDKKKLVKTWKSDSC